MDREDDTPFIPSGRETMYFYKRLNLKLLARVDLTSCCYTLFNKRRFHR